VPRHATPAANRAVVEDAENCPPNFWSYFFLAGDLNEIPRRIAAFFIDSDDRWVSLTTSSNDFEERASSINRRSSPNDQRLFRTIQKPSVRTKPPSHVCAA
jgi:hypothetical protein